MKTDKQLKQELSLNMKAVYLVCSLCHIKLSVLSFLTKEYANQ